MSENQMHPRIFKLYSEIFRDSEPIPFNDLRWELSAQFRDSLVSIVIAGLGHATIPDSMPEWNEIDLAAVKATVNGSLAGNKAYLFRGDDQLGVVDLDIQ